MVLVPRYSQGSQPILLLPNFLTLESELHKNTDSVSLMLSFSTQKKPKYIYRREFNSGYQLTVSLRIAH